METEHVELPHINQNTGIDLGIKELCITSAGKKYENPKIIRKDEKKLVNSKRTGRDGEAHSPASPRAISNVKSTGESEVLTILM